MDAYGMPDRETIREQYRDFRRHKVSELCDLADAFEDVNWHDDCAILRCMARRIGRGIVDVNRRGEIRELATTRKAEGREVES